jgi:hypothetical protein
MVAAIPELAPASAVRVRRIRPVRCSTVSRAALPMQGLAVLPFRLRYASHGHYFGCGSGGNAQSPEDLLDVDQ